MSDKYQRVEYAPAHEGDSSPWIMADDGPLMVVPADAIVIERQFIPEVTVANKCVRAGSTSWPIRLAMENVHELRTDGLELIAIADYLTEHPPVDEAQVEALQSDLGQLDASLFGTVGGPINLREIAERMVAQGWTKPAVA